MTKTEAPLDAARDAFHRANREYHRVCIERDPTREEYEASIADVQHAERDLLAAMHLTDHRHDGPAQLATP